MIPDPKPIHQKKDLPKCKVNSCTRKGEFENGICDKCKTILNKVPKRNKPIRKQSPANWSKAFREAKRDFQLLRRLQEADNNGMVNCVHGRKAHYKQVDAGHYLPSHYKNTCFNPLNVWPQEKNKNLDMGNPVTAMEYRSFLIKKIGLGEVEKLEQTYKMERKFAAFELVEMSKLFRIEIEIIKKEKGI